MTKRSIKERFWEKVKLPEMIGTNECWLWQASKNYYHYGYFEIDGKTRLAHQVSYEMCIGKIPDGLNVLHNCPNGDNPSCVNPAHLWLGTKAENSADMVNKNRQASGARSGARAHPERLPYGDRNGSRLHPERLPRGNRHGSHTHPESRPRGEKQGQSKLTWEKAREIRIKYAKGNVSQNSLAKEFKISQLIIFRILHNLSWKEE